jgi:hypothetical protein
MKAASDTNLQRCRRVRMACLRSAAGFRKAALLVFLAGVSVVQAAHAEPSISQQPRSQAVTAGTAASFSVGATGDSLLSYQWFFGNTNINGATNASLLLTNVQVAQAGNYSVTVADSSGSVTSSNGLLTVFGPLINIDFGADAGRPEVGFAATGDTTNDYWNPYERGSGFVANLRYAPGSASGSGVVVENDVGSYSSGNLADSMYNTYLYDSSANIIVIVTNLTPGIFDIYIYGHGAVESQNGVYGLSVNGASHGTNSTLAAAGWDSSVWQEGVQYVVFRGVVITNSAQVLTVTAYSGLGGYSLINGMQIMVSTLQAPAITVQPQSQAVTAGNPASLSVTATGTAPLSYQWLFNGTNLITGATNPVLAFTAAPTNAGTYSAMVTNYLGSAASDPAALSVGLTLVAARSGGVASVSWPASAAGFVLESATNLIPPVAWSTLTNVPSTNGQNCVITLPMPPYGSTFYRLVHP